MFPAEQVHVRSNPDAGVFIMSNSPRALSKQTLLGPIGTESA
jgi:hypothetical protein